MQCRRQFNKRKRAQTCTKAMFETGGDDFHTLKRIIRLNSAIQNRSVKEFFDLACDECKFLFGSLPPFNPFSLSKGVFDLLHALMLHNNVSFVVKPTADEGFDIGVRWTLASKDHNVPLALGCTIHTSHVYKGHLMIQKANHIMEYLLNIGNISKKVEEKVVLLLDKIVPKDKLEGKRREAFMYILMSLVVMLLYYALMQKLVL
ncbi:hypothetical protein FCM35_KLT04428 [Carex littledalei]|uniref:Uncharacterized protein n=1 Tax=Carex littledalei TaxID=544730 RepID=A0A833QWR2_9POAL|nr:hypothetical protein FCM35_KLT04428 [Carex littledalei]